MALWIHIIIKLFFCHRICNLIQICSRGIIRAFIKNGVDASLTIWGHQHRIKESERISISLAKRTSSVDGDVMKKHCLLLTLRKFLAFTVEWCKELVEPPRLKWARYRTLLTVKLKITMPMHNSMPERDKSNFFKSCFPLEIFRTFPIWTRSLLRTSRFH